MIQKISKDLVLYSNTKIQAESYKAERLLSVFLFLSHQIETISPHVFRKLSTYLSVWSKLW